MENNTIDKNELEKNFRELYDELKNTLNVDNKEIIDIEVVNNLLEIIKKL